MILKFYKNKFFFALAILIIIRIVLVLLTINNIIPNNIDIKPELWSRSDWGDQASFFNEAKIVINGEKPTGWPIGFSLFLIPFIKFFNADNVSDIMRIVIFFQSVILYSVITLMVYYLAKEVLISKLKGFIIASFFVVYPYLFHLFFTFLAPRSEIMTLFIVDKFTQLMFLDLLSDPLSMFLALLSLILIWRLFKNNFKNLILISFFMGFVVSCAVITRWQNAILVPFYALVLLFHRKFKSFLYFVLGGLLLCIFQLNIFYQKHGVFLDVYKEDYSNMPQVPFASLYYPFRIFTYPMDHGCLLLIPLILGLILIFLGMKKIIKNNKRIGFLVSGYFWVIIFFIIFLEPTLRNPRYFLPIIPIAFILLYAGLEYLLNSIKLYGK